MLCEVHPLALRINQPMEVSCNVLGLDGDRASLASFLGIYTLHVEGKVSRALKSAKNVEGVEC